MSPLGDDYYVADLAITLGFPLVVVSANVLGTINQTLQTLMAAASFGEALSVAGVVLNHPKRDADDASAASNHQQLTVHCRRPLLAEVAWQAAHFQPPVDWFALANKR